MSAIIDVKPNYLSEQEIEKLHQKSKEWFSEIAFWRDEAAFFYSLITKKIFSPIPLKARSIYERIEKELISITVNEFEKLQQAVEHHENELNKLYINKINDEGNLRKKHHQLVLTFSRYEKRFKSLKKEVFTLVEMITKEKNHLIINTNK